jgi:predicted ATPase
VVCRCNRSRRRPPAYLTSSAVRKCESPLYENRVFFVRPLGFVKPTAARRISYEDSLAFEAVHEAVYWDHGFDLIDVASSSVDERVAAVEARIAREQQGGAKEPAGS